MIQPISLKTPVARKDYKCNACEEFMLAPDCYFPKLTFSEKKVMVKSIRHEKGLIKKGTMYEHQVNKYEGEIYSWRARLDVDEIMEKYGFYREDDY